MTEVKSLYDIGYEHGVKYMIDKYDETCRIANEIRMAVGCKTGKECWELARNGDIQVVKHGRWMDCKGLNGKDYRKCSECLHTQGIIGLLNYCPICGAKMDLDEVNNG